MEPWARATIYMMTGVTAEIFFTGIKSMILQKDKRLQGYTQIWVMPLYALVGLFSFEYIHYSLLEWNVFLRLPLYALLVYFFEFMSGYIEKKITGEIPWKYEGKWSVGGYIDLSYFPFWMFLGYIFEIIHNYVINL